MTTTEIAYQFEADLAAAIKTIPEKGIVSQTLARRDGFKATLFGFAPGEELTEHTASKQAILHFLDGEGELSLGEERYDVKAGSWTWMPPNLPHGVRARTELRMLLLLID
jgi:quercetin dioxygenase-like cupin family protein